MYKVGIIGAGKMGKAISIGLINSGLYSPKEIIMSDINIDAGREVEKYEIKFTTNNIELVKNSSVIILAVKPDKISEVCKEIAEEVENTHIIISIAAGISIKILEDYFGGDSKIARVMPNTPALVQAGISAVSFNKKITEADKERVIKILKSIGETVIIEEKYMDAVTGLSGSGPAYISLVISGLIDGGIKMGLSREVAYKLAVNTVLGTARLMKETGKQPEEIKYMVSSPGGTTVEGTFVLETYKIRAAFIEAVEKSTLKSKKLIKER